MTSLYILFHIFVPTYSFLINFENNACPKLHLYRIAPFSSQCYVNPDVNLEVPQIVQRYGYKIETFNVTTEDGYILTLFKISPKNEIRNFTVFLQHGIGTSSRCWVVPQNYSLAFNLVDQGYEVWLGNVRGSRYSKNSKTSSVKDPKFWNFNLDIIARHDLKSMLGFAAKLSGKKIHYMGHSMGTTLVLMLLASFGEEVSPWLQSLTLLAPVAYLDDIGILTSPAEILLGMLKYLGFRGLSYEEDAIHSLLTRFCQFIPEICILGMNMVLGKTTLFRNDDFMLLLNNVIGGTSIDQLIHYVQIASSKRFQKFDYGEIVNLEEYGYKRPPRYDLGKIKLPIGLLYGENDSFYRKQNVDRLHNELGSSRKLKYAAEDGNQEFDHADFFSRTNISRFIIQVLAEFEKY